MAHLRYGAPPRKGDKNPALTTFLSLAMTTATHPLTSVKILVQVGHEPIPAVASKTFFGNTVFRLPGLIPYGKQLVKTDGYLRLFSGLVPRLMNQFISSMVNEAVLGALQSTEDRITLEPFEVQTVEKTYQEELKDFAVESCKQTAAKCVAVIVSHPFQVITIRMIVQYVGKEAAYSSVTSSMKEIMNTRGFLGFFDGIVPRIVGEVLCLWICRSAHFVVSKYGLDKEVSSKKEINMYTTALSQWLASYLTYPFTLVSNIMIVNNKGLAGGVPPSMPIYGDWVDCFKHLRSGNNLWRGSSLLRRTAKEETKKGK